VEGLGHLCAFTLTGGHRGETTQVGRLLSGVTEGAFIADKAYDWDALEEEVVSRGMEFVVPPRSSRKNPREYDKHTYKERSAVERFFCFIKGFRRISTRYDKTIESYTAFITLIATLDWLR
jgi:transposase